PLDLTNGSDEGKESPYKWG
ncbi:hypothetical protein A2U01_0036558, partial [Trifolium medium]|nr:hypothetical protein [Trifolium medium]